jgi:2-polyprenyl-3-methyl-5-hydroxy-6-metoxy-1,4-benzoquinol methylase
LLDLLLLRAWHVHKELRGLSQKDNRMNILDAGSGYGQYSYWMQKHFKNCNILAVDVKEEQVADCNQFFQSIGADNVKFEIADLTKFTKPDSYDLVLSVDVMEHILEDEQVFRNFHTSMKTGAMLLISTPSDQGQSDREHPQLHRHSLCHEERRAVRGSNARSGVAIGAKVPEAVLGAGTRSAGSAAPMMTVDAPRQRPRDLL